MYRLLIVEDDRGIAEGVREQAEAWDITAHSNGFSWCYGGVFAL